MSPSCRVRVRIADISGRRAAAALAALAPDNVSFPPGQSMEMSVEGGALVISVAGGTVAQLVATVDEAMAHAQAALEATSG